MEGFFLVEDYEVWVLIFCIVEFIFNCGRNGWIIEIIVYLKVFSWSYCIFVEERYGFLECVIILYSLIYLYEDIIRFLLFDNFWYFYFEKVV